ncbi:hypothetical protein SAMN06265375_101339 [Muriicola jejuensis]|uniref:Uncharacterized protein n=1 Tax=Muriicola jejuensis TaxID=504488 RepID=A0A6P0UA85_9FLAO|nr:hypothetical protein [Muriicola jejuensis]NER10125.1 hypothetical protein [Muriicola jejuensis]SMP02810.1 hypothetical protein SAMN06265375_101339 [Muriicola jejuensis]
MELKKIRSGLVVFVSVLWLLSITAPPILQLLDENSPGIAFNLNEEESKEQEKVDHSEETLFSLPFSLRNGLSSLYSEHSAWNTNETFRAIYLEIKLPPPEELS